MIASTHLAVGSAVALFGSGYLPVSVNNKLKLGIVFSAGIASHIVLDAFPHREYIERWPWFLVIAETLAMLVLILSVRQSISRNLSLFIGMAGAAMPDLLHISHGELANSLDVFHFFHGSLPLAFSVSMFWQSIMTCLAIVYIKIKATKTA